VITISLVCGSRSRWKVKSSSQNLVQRARKLAFIAASLRRGSQTDHRRRERDRRHRQLAQRRLGVKILDLGHGHDPARAGFIDRTGFLACTSNRAVIFTPFRTPTTGTVESFFSVPENTRMKLSFCTNGSMRVLNTWATRGPAGSALISTSSPAAFFAVRTSASGGNAQSSIASINSGKPMPDLPETHTIGINAPWATALTISFEISSSVGGVPSKYRSVTASSDFDDRLQQRLANLGWIHQGPSASAGGLSVLATPRNPAPWPSGTFNKMHALPNRS